MKTVLFALLAMTGTLPALADAPKTLKVVKSVEIQAPLEKVWAAVKDFDSLNKWHPAFTRDEIVKGTNNQPGAVRKLTVKDGPTFTEELLAFDETTHSYRYRIIESPLPMQNYVAHISVRPGRNGGTRVTWSGTFKRRNPADNPPEAESDEGVIKFVSGVYDTGLGNLRKMLAH